jgi:hypothetical protein
MGEQMGRRVGGAKKWCDGAKGNEWEEGLLGDSGGAKGEEGGKGKERQQGEGKESGWEDSEGGKGGKGEGEGVGGGRRERRVNWAEGGRNFTTASPQYYLLSVLRPLKLHQITPPVNPLFSQNMDMK